MTNQELFDIVAAHLIKQGRRSLDEFSVCQYRGTNGDMCAVGCLIKDELYDHGLETLGIRHPRVILALKKSIGNIDNTQIRLLTSLQRLHDNMFAIGSKYRTFAEKLEDFCRTIGDEFNIKFTGKEQPC